MSQIPISKLKEIILDEYRKLTEVNQKNLYVADQRYVGKYIIWVLSDNKSFRTAIMGKKGFDNFSSNDTDDLFKLWNLAKKFKGKPIPDIATEGKLTEAIGKGMKWEDLKSGTSIEFTGGTTYVVTKIDKNKLQMSLKRRGKTGGGLFAPKAKLDKSQFESQVKVGLIKYLVNTNPRK